MTIWDLKSGMKFMTESGKIYEIHGSYIYSEKEDDILTHNSLSYYKHHYENCEKIISVWNKNDIMIFCGELDKEEIEDKIKRQEEERKQQEWEGLKCRLKRHYRKYNDLTFAYSCLKEQFGYLPNFKEFSDEILGTKYPIK